jgi:hypothetical protein
MKTVTKAVLAFIWLASSTVAAEDTSRAVVPSGGRYQITMAPLWNPLEQASRATLVKLDVVTGRTWMLVRETVTITVEGKKKDLLVQGWIEVENGFEEALREVKGMTSPTKK